jgi:hypothetical protein
MITFDEALEKVLAAGSDDLGYFGGRYVGGYFLQQIPTEMAMLLVWLAHHVDGHPRLLEVGSASGGMARMLDDVIGCQSIHVVDDNKHRRAPSRPGILPTAVEFIGDSHSPEAAAFVRDRGPFDLAIVDAGHEYDDVAADTRMAYDSIAPGGLLIFHDFVACEGVRRWVTEIQQSADPRFRFETFIGSTLGLAVFRRV